MTAAESVFEAVGAITFGPAQTFRNLTLVPLVANEPGEADYAVLDEALALGTIAIEETSEDGRVPGAQGSQPRREGGPAARW